MAIIAISRQVASLGDEIAESVAKKTGYKFITRHDLEKRIVDLGFPAEKLKKYDEKKPGFFASLVKDRDEYLNYLQTAVLEAASEGNCILIGRGSFLILENLPNLLSLRFIASDTVRMERLMKEFNWTEKQAIQRITESDTNRKGFHKSFFNAEIDDPSHFLMVLNTGVLDVDMASNAIAAMDKAMITPEKEEEGKVNNMKTIAYHINRTILYFFLLTIAIVALLSFALKQFSSPLVNAMGTTTYYLTLLGVIIVQFALLWFAFLKVQNLSQKSLKILQYI